MRQGVRQVAEIARYTLCFPHRPASDWCQLHASSALFFPLCIAPSARQHTSLIRSEFQALRETHAQSAGHLGPPASAPADGPIAWHSSPARQDLQDYLTGRSDRSEYIQLAVLPPLEVRAWAACAVALRRSNAAASGMSCAAFQDFKHAPRTACKGLRPLLDVPAHVHGIPLHSLHPCFRRSGTRPSGRGLNPAGWAAQKGPPMRRQQKRRRRRRRRWRRCGKCGRMSCR